MQDKTSSRNAKGRRRISLDFLQSKSATKQLHVKHQSLYTSQNVTSSTTCGQAKRDGDKLAFLSFSLNRPKILRTQSSCVLDSLQERHEQDGNISVSSDFPEDFDTSDASFSSVFSHCPTPPPRRLSEISVKSYDQHADIGKTRRSLFAPARKSTQRVSKVTSWKNDIMGKAFGRETDHNKTPTHTSLNRVNRNEDPSSTDFFGKKQRRDSDIGLNTSANSTKKRRSDYFYSLPGLKSSKMTSPKTLRDFLKKKSRAVAFRAFLQKEFSEENLDFWIEVESYRKQRSAKQIKLASAIYQTYIEVNASREVNIDAQTRKNTKENLIQPTSSTFDLAQARVYILMERDSFQRFLIKEWNSSEENKLDSSMTKEIAKNRRKSTCIQEKKPSPKFESFLHPNITERRKRKVSSQI